MNMKNLAKRVEDRQWRGKCPSRSIAQVRETLRIAIDILANEIPYSEVIETLSRHEKGSNVWKNVRKCF